MSEPLTREERIEYVLDALLHWQELAQSGLRIRARKGDGREHGLEEEPVVVGGITQTR